MIALHVENEERQHFIVTGDEPFRVEIIHTPDKDIIAHVYQGVRWDEEQDPIGGYDGTLLDNNSWAYIDEERKIGV